MPYYLSFLGTSIELDIADDAAAAFFPVQRFFRHLLSETCTGAPTFRVAARAYDPSTEIEPTTWSTPLHIIRRSSAAEFNFDAHIIEPPGRRIYINRDTLLDTPLDANLDNTFELHITPGSTVQVIDFLRDLIIRNEEIRGTVVFHASGVQRENQAVIFAGPKGAGKTTTMLAALHDPSWRYFTGDKLFCTFGEDGVTVHPWRDYPYIGVGTIRADPRLERFVREKVDARIDTHQPSTKVLIDPDLFESWLGCEFSAMPRRLSAILLPEVAPTEPLTVWPLQSENERWAYLNKIIDRQADTTFFTWQSYLVPDYARFYESLARLRAALRGIEMVRLKGELASDLDTVLAHAGVRNLTGAIQ